MWDAWLIVHRGCFAILPLPYIGETVSFIQKVSKSPLKPDGWGITTQIGDRYLGDPAYAPVWEELNRQKATIFVHPAESTFPPGLKYGPFVQEFPFDTCRAITSALTTGFFSLYPNISTIFSHLGGAYPYLADRIGSQHMDALIRKNNGGRSTRDILSQSSPSHTGVGHIFFDTSISSSAQYPLVLSLGIKASQLLYATDWPYTERLDETGCYQAGYEAPKGSGCFGESEMEGIERGNALDLFPRLKGEFERAFK
jgi:6-methylsalicylate decarboxylase